MRKDDVIFFIEAFNHGDIRVILHYHDKILENGYFPFNFYPIIKDSIKQEEYWSQYFIELIKKFSKNEIRSSDCIVGITHCPNCGSNSCGCHDYWKYDPNKYVEGITLAFLPSCFKECEQADFSYEIDKRYCDKLRCSGNWSDKFIKNIYDFAKKYKIDCIKAEEFLEGDVIHL